MSEVTFGGPWHGIWNSATGKVKAPDTVEFDLPGNAPTESGITGGAGYPVGDQGRIGECHLFKSMGAVDLSGIGGDPGKTWLNYTLISGGQHRVHGRNIGRYSWLFRGANGKIWIAEITAFNYAATGGSYFYVRPFVRIRRFCAFWSGVTLPQYTVEIPSTRINASSVISGSGAVTFPRLYITLDAISHTGDKAIFAVAYDSAVAGTVTARRLVAMFSVNLTDTGAGFTATASEVIGWDSEGIFIPGSTIETYGPLINNGWDNYASSRDYSIFLPINIGAQYNASGELVKVHVDKTFSTKETASTINRWTDSYAGQTVSYFQLESHSASTETLRLYIGDVLVEEVIGTMSVDYVRDGATSYVDYSMTVGSESISKHFDFVHPTGTPAPSGGYFYGPQALWLLNPANLYFDGCFWFVIQSPLGIDEQMRLFFRRITNSIWQAVLKRQDDSTKLWFYPARGFGGVSVGTYGPVNNTDPAPIFGSQNPVTNELEFGTVPVCFI